MTAGRAFALLFVLTFYGISTIPDSSPFYYAAGVVLLAGFAIVGYGVTHRTR